MEQLKRGSMAYPCSPIVYFGGVMGPLLFIIASLILAKGDGFVVTPEDIASYWVAYVREHGEPETVLQKKEILLNYLGDYLMLRRAKDVGLDKSKEFKNLWREAEREIENRCLKEHLGEAKCQSIKSSFMKLLLISLLIQKEVIPKIKISESEIQTLVLSHKGMKKGKRLDRKGAMLFLFQKKKAEVLDAYIEDLIKMYHVKVFDQAIDRLNAKTVLSR